MNRTKLAVLLSLPAVLALSANSNAATESDALRACSASLTEKFEARQDSEISTHVDESGIRSGRHLRGTTVFHIDVYNGKSREVIARADCYVNRRGHVTSLRTLQLSEKPAAERSLL
jgi:hypothetical protein